MKYVIMTLFSLATLSIGIGQTGIHVNPNGTHTIIHQNGNTTTQVNPDGTHSTITRNGNTSTQVNPDGTHTILHHNNNNSTEMSDVSPDVHAITDVFATDHEGIEAACMNYIEGFYEGDSLKLAKALRPSLHKIGFWKKKGSEDYGYEGNMTYKEALEYAVDVKEKKNYAKPDAPKDVQVLDVSNHIACAKVTAWWGYDYMFLSRDKAGWKIEQVIWEGPLKK